MEDVDEDEEAWTRRAWKRTRGRERRVEGRAGTVG